MAKNSQSEEIAVGPARMPKIDGGNIFRVLIVDGLVVQQIWNNGEWAPYSGLTYADISNSQELTDEELKHYKIKA